MPRARAAYPAVAFEVGIVEELDAVPGALGGVLAWYSLIHHAPAALDPALAALARAIRPDGGLLVGFFAGDSGGPEAERFDHAVTPAWRWSPAALAARLETAGFDVVEIHTRTGPGHRPHGAITARRR